MKTPPSALAPFLRSDAQGDVLAAFVLAPDDELSVTEVHRRTHTALAVAHREIERLVDAGVLVDRRLGRLRLARVNPDYPLLRPLTELVTATYGPVPVIEVLLSDVPGIREAYIFGSWAARRAGEAGPTPHDIDVLVVGSTPRDRLHAVADAAQTRLAREVNVTRVSGSEWDEGTAPFIHTVQARPLVRLSLERELIGVRTTALESRSSGA